MYVGLVNKSTESIDDEIKRHLIMSQYKIMLTMLKNKRMDSLKKSFYYAASNMNVAVYLSSMAKDEGITNHEILNEWIDLREKYYTYQDSANEIKRTILLSSLSTVLGSLPRAFASGAGAVSRGAMGIAVVGGMVCATFLSLFVIPAIYSYLSTEKVNVIGEEHKE